MHRMDMRSREQYLKALLGRYLRVRKRGKNALLDECCRNTGMARKSVLRKIAGLLKGESPPRRGVVAGILWWRFRACGP